jgi:outer membrane protein
MSSFGRIGVLAALIMGVWPPWASAHQSVPADTLRLGVADAVRYALRDGVEAALARQDVLTAQAQVGLALSYALPEVSFSGSYTRNLKKPVIFFEIEEGDVQSFEIGQDNAWMGTLSLRQVLWASGRVRHGWESARAQARAATLGGDDAAAAIARDVQKAYYNALLAAEQSRIARESLAQAERTVGEIAARVQQGIAPEFEHLRASVTVANRRPALTRAENAQGSAVDALKHLLGVPLQTPTRLMDTLAYVPYVGTLEEISETARRERRDLQAAREQAAAAELRSKAQAANQRPTLYLDGNLSWQGETSKGLWPGDREAASSAQLGLSLTWPLLDGFRNRNQTRIANAMAEKSRLEVQRLESAVLLEVRARFADVISIAQEIGGAEETVSLARRAYSIANVRYQKGLSTLVELQDAELALIQSQFDLSETLYRYNVAVAELEYSIGQGPRLDEERGNQ